MDEFILYKTQEIKLKSKIMNGCESENFLKQGWEMITLERLFMNYYGRSLYRSIFQIQGLENRVNFIVEQVERMTGLKQFGLYLSKLITIDALFLNEDRHTHNIAVLLDEKGDYHYCPIFDQGASLLSDYMFDYPFTKNIFAQTKEVKSKTFANSFDEQQDAIGKLYPDVMKVKFCKKDVHDLIVNEHLYANDIKLRVEQILYFQMEKYSYLFTS